MHLAARFCAKEAVAKALGLSAWSFRDVEIVAGRRRAERPAERARAAARAAELGVEPRCRSRTPTGAGRRGGPPAVSPLPDWLDPLYEAAEMRAVDPWAIEEQGVPVTGPDGACRRRARPGRGGRGGGRPAARVVGKGNNGGDGLVAARLLREDGHVVDVLASLPDELRGDAATNLERLPGDPPETFDPAGSRARAWWWTRCSAPGSRASRASRWRAR